MRRHYDCAFVAIWTTARPRERTCRLTAPLPNTGVSNPKVRRATLSIFSTCELRERISSAFIDSQMASLEKRSVSNLIEVMADERWERLVEQQGIAYAQTVAGALNLKLDADNPADREKLRRAILDLVAGRKMPKQKGRG